jgi:cyclase
MKTFLRLLDFAMTFVLSCTLAWSQVAVSDIPVAMTGYETVKLADGIYAFISPESNGAIVTGNSIAIVGDDGVLVVDSGHFPSLTARMIEQIKQYTNNPVRFLVNTHWHPDHNSGNGLYRQTFPGIQIISTPTTRAEIETVLPKKEVDEAKIAQVEDILKKGVFSDGTPVGPADRKYFAKVGVELEAFRPELKKADHSLPTLTFKDELTIYLGKREVRVMFLGRGNTGGDAVIYVPDSKVLMTGDLLVYPVPYPFGSYIGEWIGVLKQLQAMRATEIVPGHGPVMHDQKYLDLTVRLLESTKSQVDAAVKQGLSLEETKKNVDLSELRRSFVGDDKDREYVFDGGYVPVAVTRAYREAKEGVLHDEN